MKKNTFKILFHIRGNRTNKDGKASIIARIAINGEYERVSTLFTFWPTLPPDRQFSYVISHSPISGNSTSSSHKPHPFKKCVDFDPAHFF